MLFVESIMDRYDAPARVITSSSKGAELDYGPQYREGSQPRPAAGTRMRKMARAFGNMPPK
jgi:indolepyruvate decarboxylase